MIHLALSELPAGTFISVQKVTMLLWKNIEALTSKLTRLPPLTSAHRNIIAGSALQEMLIDSLKACSSETYILVSQPGVSINDYAQPDSAPHLRRWMKDDNDKIKSRGIVSEVVGSLDEDALVEVLKNECGATVGDLEASGMEKREVQVLLSVYHHARIMAPQRIILR